VNRQIGVKVSKFPVVAGPLPTGHVTQRMRIAQWPFSYRHITGLNIITAYNGGKTKDIEHRHFVFVTLIDLPNLE